MTFSAAFDIAIARVAQRQHGAFSARQAFTVGGTERMIRHRVATGRWLRLDTSVYALPGNPATWMRQCWASVLTHRLAAVSGRAAAVIHRFPRFRPGRPEITVPQGADHRCALARVRQSDLVETTTVGGLPVCTIAQTVLDVARYLDERSLGRLVDDLELDRRDVLDAVRDRYAALARSRRPGVGLVRAVLLERGDGYVPPASELEAVLLEVLATVPGIPGLIRQARLPWLAAGAGRVDVLVPAWSAIIEGDGRRWHTRVDDFEADRARDNEAVVHGYRPLRFTWHELTRQSGSVRDTVARLGRLATSDPGRSGNDRQSGSLVA
jgi:hypothetical protein